MQTVLISWHSRPPRQTGLRGAGSGSARAGEPAAVSGPRMDPLQPHPIYHPRSAWFVAVRDTPLFSVSGSRGGPGGLSLGPAAQGCELGTRAEARSPGSRRVRLQVRGRNPAPDDCSTRDWGPQGGLRRLRLGRFLSVSLTGSGIS